MTFHSLPTIYAGITFRSRLEARWAVFFDALKLRWEYEPEGVSVDSGGYFPDFRVSPGNVSPLLVEVKGDPKALTAEYLAKLHEVCRATGMMLAIFGHMPDWRWTAGRTPAVPLIGPTARLEVIHLGVDFWEISTRPWPTDRPYTQTVVHPCGESMLPEGRAALDAARNERFGLFPVKKKRK